MGDIAKLVQESGLVKITKDQRGLLLDITSLVSIEKLRNDIPNVDVYSAPAYMRDFTTACDILGRMIFEAQRELDMAVLNSKHEEAMAKLDRAPAYLKEKGILDTMKDSNSLRETYVQLDEGYRAAKEMESKLRAFVSYLENKLSCYKQDHYTVKATFDKFASSNPVGMKSGGKLGDIE